MGEPKYTNAEGAVSVGEEISCDRLELNGASVGEAVGNRVTGIIEIGAEKEELAVGLAAVGAAVVGALVNGEAVTGDEVKGAFVGAFVTPAY